MHVEEYVRRQLTRSREYKITPKVAATLNSNSKPMDLNSIEAH